MAKLSMKLKQQKAPHSVLKKYGICRVCFRELAYKGEIPGVKKASW